MLCESRYNLIHLQEYWAKDLYEKVRAGKTDMLVNNQQVMNKPFIRSNSCQPQNFHWETGYLNMPGVTFVAAKLKQI